MVGITPPPFYNTRMHKHLHINTCTETHAHFAHKHTHKHACRHACLDTWTHTQTQAFKLFDTIYSISYTIMKLFGGLTLTFTLTLTLTFTFTFTFNSSISRGAFAPKNKARNSHKPRLGDYAIPNIWYRTQ